MSKFRDGMIGPTIILFAICLIITAALAAVYNVTKPVIDAGAIAAADMARREVLPDGDSFTAVEATLPDGVVDAYKADNGAGFVFTSQAKGFGGAVTWVIGMDANGGVTGISLFDHDETPGLGTKVGEADYLQNFLGNTDPASVDAITGATRTSDSLKNSVIQAKEAFELVK
jgi:electron transport complex protein RnfG